MFLEDEDQGELKQTRRENTNEGEEREEEREVGGLVRGETVRLLSLLFLMTIE